MLHAIPAVFVRGLARQGRQGLRLSKPSPSHDLEQPRIEEIARRPGFPLGPAPTSAQLEALPALGADRVRDLDCR